MFYGMFRALKQKPDMILSIYLNEYLLLLILAMAKLVLRASFEQAANPILAAQESHKPC